MSLGILSPGHPLVYPLDIMHTNDAATSRDLFLSFDVLRICRDSHRTSAWHIMSY